MECPPLELGTVVRYDATKGWGIIRPDGEAVDLFVHHTSVEDRLSPHLEPGQRVRFSRGKTNGRQHAVQVAVLPIEPKATFAPTDTTGPTPLHILANASPAGKPGAIPIDETMESEEIEELDRTYVDVSLLQEIANWKREAKAEDNDRYFWHVREVDQIAQGDKYFVIGRKGSGKTAICEYFDRLSGKAVFAEKLSFKNFPFNELYEQKNAKYTPPNQFISIWKYLIYSTICRLMIRNESVDPKVREQLRHLYEDGSPLRRRVGHWLGNEFSVSLFGLSLTMARDPQNLATGSWIESLDYLEDFVLAHAGCATYYILFDELDEDYRDIVEAQQYQQYTALITSLFKAVQDIRSTTKAAGVPGIRPVVFLRDDIYELVQDSDKNKWGDFRVDLLWEEEKIKKLVAFRISRAIDPNCDRIMPFDVAWSKVFGVRPIGVGKGQKNLIGTFDFIARSTLLRPRDFVAYLQNCARYAVEEEREISPAVVKRVDKAFSNYLKSEIVDELFAVLPDIQMVLDVISQLRKWNFTIREFEAAYKDSVDRGFIKEQNAKLVLRVLYLFSVLGNQARVNRYVFRYQNSEARLNFNERLVVHRGLFKALQIL